MTIAYDSWLLTATISPAYAILLGQVQNFEIFRFLTLDFDGLVSLVIEVLLVIDDSTYYIQSADLHKQEAQLMPR